MTEPENETTTRKAGRATRNKAADDAPPMPGQTGWEPVQNVLDRHAIPKPSATSPQEVDAQLTEMEQRHGLESCGVCGRTLRNHPGNEPCKPPERSNAGGKPAKSRQPDAELRVMRRMLQLLGELPNDAARRCVLWLADRYDDTFDA